MQSAQSRQSTGALERPTFVRLDGCSESIAASQERLRSATSGWSMILEITVTRAHFLRWHRLLRSTRTGGSRSRRLQCARRVRAVRYRMTDAVDHRTVGLILWMDSKTVRFHASSSEQLRMVSDR